MDWSLENGIANRIPRRFRATQAAAPFVGRDGEVRRVMETLDLAAEGQGGVMFLTGQPGIGKTRLAREALALAKARGFITLEGRAHSLEAGLSYAPLIEALGPLLRSLDPVSLRTLASDLPSLGRLFEGFGLPQPDLVGDPNLEKTRLFEAMFRLLYRLARNAPVALFVDDLHQADPATLELLHYLVRGMVDQRVLFLASYNTDALDTANSLQALVVSLQQDGLFEEIIIPRLKRDAVGEMARAILGGEAPSDLLALLDARAGGTPLFIEALLAALIDSTNLVCTDQGWVLNAEGAAVLPPSVRRLILHWLRRLTPIDRRVVELIAVIGNAITHTILRAASGLEDEDLIESLGRLMAAGLVVEGMDRLDSTYSITHPLIQEVAYAELHGAARRRAHMAAIRALEAFQGKDAVNDLVHHYRNAGIEADPARALEVLVAAGERAWSVYDSEQAAQYYADAAALLRGGRREEDLNPRLLPWLLERLGDAMERSGKLGAALDAWNEALVLLAGGKRGSANVAASRLYHRLAKVDTNLGHFDAARAHLEDGLAALTGQGPAEELADLYVTRCIIFGRAGDSADFAESTAELLSLAERLALPSVQAEAKLFSAWAGVGRNDLTDARERAQHALAIAEQTRDLAMCHRAHAVLVAIAVRLGEHRLARYHAERSLALARRLGAPSYEILPLLCLAYTHFLSGAWDESHLSCMEAIWLARRLGNPRDLAYSLAERAMLLGLRGEVSAASACISEMRTTIDEGTLGDRLVSELVDIAEAAIALEQGDAKRALGIAEDFVQSLVSVAAPTGLIYFPLGLLLLAEAQVAAGEAEVGLETARKLRELGPHGTPYLAAMASRAEGLARQTLGQRGAAMACLACAYDNFTSLEMPFEAARILLERAILVSTERPELSAGIARQSLAMFERLGARRHADRARQLLDGLGASQSAAPRDHPKEGPLSPRELEVARLVAEGLTSVQIAKRMVLSRRTISSHLDRIYRRLEIGSRSALTRYVIENGLLSPAQAGD